MNSTFYKGLIYYYGKSYMFLIKINKINDTTGMSIKFIAKEILYEKDINTIKTNNNNKLLVKKKKKKLRLEIDNFFAFFTNAKI